MRRCSLGDRIGKICYALPSPWGTCPGGTYSADESTNDGSGTINLLGILYSTHPTLSDVDAASSSAPLTNLLSEGDFFLRTLKMH